MATKTFEELKQLAIQIRDEKTNKQNTATRVGTAMLEHINKLEQDYYDKTTISEDIGIIKKGIYKPDSILFSGDYYVGKYLSINFTRETEGKGAIVLYGSDERILLYFESSFNNEKIPEGFAKCVVKYSSLNITDDYIFDFNNKKNRKDIESLKDTVNKSLIDISESNTRIDSIVSYFSESSKIYGTYKTGSDKIETNDSPTDLIRQIVDNEAKEGDTYIVTGYGGTNYRLFAFVDAEENIISKDEIGEHDVTSEFQLITAPESTVKAIFSSYKSYNSTFKVGKNGILGTIKSLNDSINNNTSSIQKNTKDIESLKDTDKSSPLKDKKASFVGDSIMIGQPSKAEIENISIKIQRDFGINCKNIAKGGSVLLYPWYTGDAYSIYWQLTQVDKDSDYVIIQGGVNGVNLNDSGKGNYAPMGEITNGFEEELDLTTQIGCLEAICKYAITNFVGKKVGFIITYEIDSYDYWKDKASKFKEVLEKWSIPYLDWRRSGVNLASNSIRSIYGIDTFSDYEEYSNKKTYNVDDKVIYNNKSYKANENITELEEWNESKWTLISSTRYDGWHCNGTAYELLAYKTAKWMETL